MRTLCAVLVTLASSLSLAQNPAKSTLSKDQIDPERKAIYRDFLAGYDNGSKTMLNISWVTEPLTEGFGNNTCLEKVGFKLDPDAPVHKFESDTFSSKNVKLVDPVRHQQRDPGDAIRRGDDIDSAVTAGFANDLFTFSEIIFDKTHEHAAFSYPSSAAAFAVMARRKLSKSIMEYGFPPRSFHAVHGSASRAAAVQRRRQAFINPE